MYIKESTEEQKTEHELHKPRMAKLKNKHDKKFYRSKHKTLIYVKLFYVHKRR